jgi:hypothetical protein
MPLYLPSAAWLETLTSSIADTRVLEGYAALTRDRFRAQASKGPSRVRCEGLFCSRSVKKTAPISHDFSVVYASHGIP